ncbi:hypothetical protein DSO57_1026221 [Entomophthora muscae]|uniref:Uncharacterized protein n=2 Tax=Entomophthora muscae TaxID=34485 RepID=A0ACC2U1K5_9FUNG|nr:hypothetical protein DSO57_1026221 [Entomophthora muscae]
MLEVARSMFKGINKPSASSQIMKPSQRLLSQIGKNHLARGVGRMTDLVIDRAKGSFVHDAVSDTDYLDLTSGIAVTSTGHCHPIVVKAIQEQSTKLIHGQVNIFYHQPMLELTEALLEVMPAKHLDSLFFTNSGAEAVEGAIKLARHATGRPNIICFQGSFHGRTIATTSITTSKTIYRDGYSPLMPGVYVAPFPYPGQILGASASSFPLSKNSESLDPTQEIEEWAVDHAIHQFELLLRQQSAPKDTAAVIIEPVLGEGGYYPAPTSFLVRLAEICQKHGILFIADEVQAGFGRTGRLFSIEHAIHAPENVNNMHFPDILVMAKGMASGMPLSAIAASRELMDRQAPGSMGGTYAGNPVACAAALATLRVLKEENVIENVLTQAEYMFMRLRCELPPILFAYGYRTDIRGLGLMIGIEFLPLQEPKPKMAAKISQYCHEHLKTLLMVTSAFDTIRIMPPLTLNAEEAERAIDDIIKATQKSLEAEFAKSSQ